MKSVSTKKFLAMALIAIMCFSLLSSGVEAEKLTGSSVVKGAEYTVKFTIGQKNYYKGGSIVETDVAPYIKDNRTMVPASFVASALGAESVLWDPASRRVIINKGSDQVIIKIDSKELLVNGKTLLMDTAAEIKDVGGGGGRTMVPIAYIAKALNVSYQWYDSTRSVEFYNYTETFDSKGDYGPSSGTETVAGSVVVTADGVRLRNKVIKGNLTIAESVGTGDVFLDNVTVEGNTYIRGGGKNSIHINGGSYHGNIIIESTPEGGIRVVVENAEGVKIVIASSEENESIILEGDFSSVEIAAPNAHVTTEGQTTIGNLIVNSNARVSLSKETVVKNTTFNASATVYSYGIMETINVNSNDVVIYTNTSPKVHNIAPGKDPAKIYTLSISDSSVSSAGKKDRDGKGSKKGGGGSGGNGGNNDPEKPQIIPITGITISPETMTLTEGGSPGTITATIIPSNATNKGVLWSSSNLSVATVDNGIVTPVAAGTARITAVSRENSSIKATCEVTVLPHVPDTFTLTLKAEPPEGGGVKFGNSDEEEIRDIVTGTFEEGEKVTVTASVYEGYVFKWWIDDQDVKVSKHETFEYTMPAKDTTLTAEFAHGEYTPEIYTVEFGVKGGLGSITATADGKPIQTGAEVEEGKKIVFTAAPGEGYRVKDWFVNGKTAGSTDSVYTIGYLQEDMDVQVEFEPIPEVKYILTLNGEGLVSEPEGREIEENTEVTITVNVPSGKQIATFTVGGEDKKAELTGNPPQYKFIIVEDTEVVVTYEEYTPEIYTVEFGVKGGVGSITATADGKPIQTGAEVEEGKEIVFTAAPGEGYRVKDWFVNGEPVGSTDSVYTIGYLQEDMDVQVEFEPIPAVKYILTLNGKGLVSEPEGREIEENTEVTITVNVPSGKQIATFTVGGEDKKAELTGDPPQYKFIIVEDTEVVVTYVELPTEDLVLWLDAANYNENTGTWIDMSGEGNSVTQGTSGNRPSYIAKGLNGKPVVRFDGSNDYLNLEWADDALDIDSMTMFLVLKNNNMSGSSQTVMGNYDQEGEVVIHKSGNSPYPITAGISSDIRSNRVEFTGDAGPYVLTYKYDNSTGVHTAYVDGSQTDTKTNKVDINWKDTTIGRNGGPTSSYVSEWYWSGEIAEIRIYSSALGDSEREEIEDTLQEKWFTLSLEEYTVNFSNPANGSLTATVDGMPINSGDKVYGGKDIVFTVTPAEGYIVDRWRVGGKDVVGETGITYVHENLGGNVEVSVVLKENTAADEDLVLWLDAANYNENTGTWIDLSGKGNSITQDTPGKRPKYVAKGLNGRPAVRFDGDDDSLELDWPGDALDLDSITMFLVLKNTNMGGSAQTVIGNYDQEGAVVIHKSGNSPYPLTAGISTPIRDNRIEFTTDAGPYVLTYKYDHSTGVHTAYVGGIQTNTKTKSVDIKWKDTEIGSNGASSSSKYPWSGEIAEIRIYSSTLGDEEREEIEEALKNKWESKVTILYNPYGDVDWDTVGHYKAHFHTHTSESDGGTAPGTVIDAYHGAGYDILALTDHDSYGYNKDTTWPWTKWGKDPEELGMLAVQGNEISATDHMCSLFNDYGNGNQTDERVALDAIQERGGLAFINHPGRYSRSDQWYIDLYKDYYRAPLIGMEVINQGDRYPNDRAVWDRVNAAVMPDIVVFGYSNDDRHSSSHQFRNYQFMLMDELTEEGLREAMYAGASYFCYEPGGSGTDKPPVPLIRSIEVTDNNTRITISADNIDLSNGTSDCITWKTNKGTAATGYSVDLEELDLKDAIFIRAELKNEYGTTYTQPFVLKAN